MARFRVEIANYSVHHSRFRVQGLGFREDMARFRVEIAMHMMVFIIQGRGFHVYTR
jgi:hypothetical protein